MSKRHTNTLPPAVAADLRAVIDAAHQVEQARRLLAELSARAEDRYEGYEHHGDAFVEVFETARGILAGFTDPDVIEQLASAAACVDREERR